jgi:hypothetical protein
MKLKSLYPVLFGTAISLLVGNVGLVFSFAGRGIHGVLLTKSMHAYYIYGMSSTCYYQRDTEKNCLLLPFGSHNRVRG